MKLIIPVCAAMFLFNSAQSSLSQESVSPSELAYLSAWQGKYPYAKVGSRTIWTGGALQRLLVQTIGAAETNKLIRYTEKGVSTPIVASGGSVTIEACQAHNCGDENFKVQVDLQAARAFVCRSTEASRDKNQSTWKAAGRDSVTVSDCEGSVPKSLR